MTNLQLWQGIESRIRDWLATKWASLKAKTLAAFQKLHTRNTGDR